VRFCRKYWSTNGGRTISLPNRSPQSKAYRLCRKRHFWNAECWYEARCEFSNFYSVGQYTKKLRTEDRRKTYITRTQSVDIQTRNSRPPTTRQGVCCNNSVTYYLRVYVGLRTPVALLVQKTVAHTFIKYHPFRNTIPCSPESIPIKTLKQEFVAPLSDVYTLTSHPLDRPQLISLATIRVVKM
jgi:hypothetical protein